MISPALRIQQNGWLELWRNSARRMIALDTTDARRAVPFQALLQSVSPFGLDTEILNDPREKTMMEIMSPGPVVNANDKLMEPGTTNRWCVIGRDNNAADFTVKYVLAKVVTEDTGA